VASLYAAVIEVIYLSEYPSRRGKYFFLYKEPFSFTRLSSITTKHDSYITPATSYTTHIMAIIDEKKADIETEHTESIEPELGAIGKLGFDDVPSIEEEAASKAAWLISITVSLGGCVHKTQWH
jgi:hypothetical protein